MAEPWNYQLHQTLTMTSKTAAGEQRYIRFTGYDLGSLCSGCRVWIHVLKIGLGIQGLGFNHGVSCAENPMP